MEDTDLAVEWTFLECFNHTKSQLNENFRKRSIENGAQALPETNQSVEYIKLIAAHGFEASQISNLVEMFISKNKIQQTSDVQKLLDKFSNHYPFLELYKNEALQGTTIVDYVLSLTSNYDICSNIFNMVPKLWIKRTSIDKLENKMGYFGCIKHILTCVYLYNSEMKQNFGIQQLISNECYTFNQNELTIKLKQQETFVQLEQIGSDAYETVNILRGNLKHFDIFSRKDGNLLNHIYCYIMNMNSLLNFKKLPQTTPEQILATDLFSLIGDIIFDNDSTILPSDIEGVVSNLNTNILHVLTKNTCPDIEISRRFLPKSSELLVNLLENLANGNVSNENLARKITNRRVFKLESRDILNYVLMRNPLVAYLVGQIHGLKIISTEEEEANFEFNPSFLKNLLITKETRIKMDLYDGNTTVAALNFDYFDVINLERLIKEKKFE